MKTDRDREIQSILETFPPEGSGFGIWFILVLCALAVVFFAVFFAIDSYEYSHRPAPTDTSGQSSSMSGIGNQ